MRTLRMRSSRIHAEGLQLGGGKLDSEVTASSRVKLLSAVPHRQLFMGQSSHTLFLVAPDPTGFLRMDVATEPSIRPFSLQLALSWLGPMPWP